MLHDPARPKAAYPTTEGRTYRTDRGQPPTYNTIDEAITCIKNLRAEIQNIQQQLNTRTGSPTDPSHKAWKMNASKAMAIKNMQIAQIENWIHQQKGHQKVNLGNSIHMKLCEAVTQMATFKRRAYSDYRTAQAAFHYLKTHNDTIPDSPELEELIKWLGRSRFPIEELYDTDDEVPTTDQGFAEEEDDFRQEAVNETNYETETDEA
jgi:hypothetical protein